MTQTSAHGAPDRTGMPAAATYDFIVVSNRLPVDTGPDGTMQWTSSPGGLVTALQPVVAKSGGAWVGWAGDVSEPDGQQGARPGDDSSPTWPMTRTPGSWWEDTGQLQALPGGPVGEGGDAHRAAGGAAEVGTVEADGVHAVPVPLFADDLDLYYEGFCNATLWPLYHDVTATPVYSRRWWHRYVDVNQRFASVVTAHAAQGATVWVHDYHLQLLPAMLRQARADLRIGFFNHIPFPPYELFAQLPWRKEIVEGLLGADLIGFQTADGAENFARACRRLTQHPVQRSEVRALGPDGARSAHIGAFPISVDAAELSVLAQSPGVSERACQIREEVGNPDILLLGVDRLDYTKGILHRLRAYGELLKENRLGPPKAVLVQIASPSRDEVEQYQRLREEVERVVGSINGDFSPVGHPAVHYLHQSFPKEEMAAMYLAADVALVTPLRDGMNLVAKEYVACRHDHGGRLVLSEFAGAADELGDAFLVNPHDIDSLKTTIMAAVNASTEDAAHRMVKMQRRVFHHDVHDWANEFLGALEGGSAL